MTNFEKSIFMVLFFMNTLLRIILSVLSALVGCIFLYSSYTKIYPIQPFEYTMVEYIHLPWILAAIVARFLVGLEAGLGTLMILQLYGRKKWILKFAFILLIAFSIYLAGLWISAGN